MAAPRGARAGSFSAVAPNRSRCAHRAAAARPAFRAARRRRRCLGRRPAYGCGHRRRDALRHGHDGFRARYRQPRVLQHMGSGRRRLCHGCGRHRLRQGAVAIPGGFAYRRGSMDTNLMQIAGHIDPVPVARAGIVDGITPREDGRVDLIGLPRLRIAELFVEAGLDSKAAKLRAKQVYHWIYHRGVSDFDAMTDIAKQMRPWLAQRFVVGRPDIVEAQVSSDGTRKWLLRTADGHDFEMVFIPDADRGTLCVSSQVGCTLNCTFCHTGTMRLVRNLTAGEIVGQVMLARDALAEWPKGRMDFAFEDGDDGADDDQGDYRADGRLLTN